MLTLNDELSYSILYFPRYRGMSITTIWQNYPILSSLPSYTSGPPNHPRDQNLQHYTSFGDMLIWVRHCFFFFFFFFSLADFPHTGSTQCNPKTDCLCNVTFNSKQPPLSIGRRMERPEDASVSHCRVRCVLLAVCLCLCLCLFLCVQMGLGLGSEFRSSTWTIWYLLPLEAWLNIVSLSLSVSADVGLTALTPILTLAGSAGQVQVGFHSGLLRCHLRLQSTFLGSFFALHLRNRIGPLQWIDALRTPYISC